MDAAMHDRDCILTFTTPRLYSIAGYLDLPAVYSTMKFLLPKFSIVSSRFATVGTKVLELWSPNSFQHVFYPGLRTPSLDIGINLPSELRRCDGHAGRFDPVVSPQHYDARNPWHGFIKRRVDDSLPECTPLLSVWDATGPGNRGIIQWQFLTKLGDRYRELRDRMDKQSRVEHINATVWQNRPIGSYSVIHRLENEFSFDEAVDSLFETQRALRFMDAWIRLAESLQNPPTNMTSSTGDIIPADDTLMGVWLNGTTEEEGLWLLRCRIPCFIVNTIESVNDSLRAERASKARNLVVGTSAALMGRSVYKFDLDVRLAGGDLRDLDNDLSIPGVIPPISETEKRRASPWGQGFVNGVYIDPRERDPQVLFKRGAAPTLHICEGEIIPPKVSSPKKGTWTRWTEDTLEDLSTRCMQILGRKRKDMHGDYRYYDRLGHRVLYFDEEVPIPASYKADPKVFGLPVPPIYFVENEENKKLAPRSASYWMYLSERPTREDEGLSYTPGRSRSTLSALNNRTDGSSPKLPIPPPRTRSPPHVTPRPPAPRSPPRPLHPSPPRFRKPVVHSSSFGTSAFHQTRSPPRKPIQPQRMSPADFRPFRGDFYRPQSNAYDPPREYPERNKGKRVERGWSDDDERANHVRRQRYSPPPASSRGSYQPPFRPRPRTPTRSPPRPARSPPRSSHSSPRPARSPPLRIADHRSPSLSSMDDDADQDWMDEDDDHAAALVVSQSKSGGPNQHNAVASSSTTVAPFTPNIPTGSQLSTLQNLFPVPTHPPIPVASVISQNTHGPCLAIWNLPPYYLWEDVVAWTLSLLPKIGNPPLDRILRSNENGTSIFWFKFRTTMGAVAFRGLVAARQMVVGGQIIHCDFVFNDDYSGACGRSTDYWSSTGLSYERSLNEQFSDLYCRLSIPGPALLARLGMAPTTVAYDRPTKAKRRRHNNKRNNKGNNKRK
jgi:hypothetical protein